MKIVKFTAILKNGRRVSATTMEFDNRQEFKAWVEKTYGEKVIRMEQFQIM